MQIFLLLLGRDVIQAHEVLDQSNGPPNAPFAYRLAFGWVIVGDICLFGGAHKCIHVEVFKTNKLDNGRQSYFLPCQNSILVKQCFISQSHPVMNSPNSGQHNRLLEVDKVGKTVFQNT